MPRSMAPALEKSFLSTNFTTLWNMDAELTPEDEGGGATVENLIHQFKSLGSPGTGLVLTSMQPIQTTPLQRRPPHLTILT